MKTFERIIDIATFSLLFIAVFMFGAGISPRTQIVPPAGYAATESKQVGDIPTKEMQEQALSFLSESGMFEKSAVKVLSAGKVSKVPASWNGTDGQLYYYLQIEVRQDGVKKTGWFTIFINSRGVPEDYAAEKMKFK